MVRKTASTRRLEVARLDDYFQQLKADSGLPSDAPPDGGINAVRGILGMSAAQLASRLGVTRAALYQLEDREASGSVTLKQLDKAADALDCDLVYAIVPRGSLEQSIRERSRKKAEEKLRQANLSMGLEAEGVTDKGFATAVSSSSGYSEALTNRRLWED